MSKSTIGEKNFGGRQLLDQINDENLKRQNENGNPNAKNRMTYMSKLGIGGIEIVLIVLGDNSRAS